MRAEAHGHVFVAAGTRDLMKARTLTIAMREVIVAPTLQLLSGCAVY